MRHKVVHCILIGMAILRAMPPGFAEENATRRGETLLSANCARCHAIGRTGISPHPEAPPFRTLSRKYPIEGLAEALAEGLSVGHPDMPEFVFQPPEIRAILDYLNAIQQK